MGSNWFFFYFYSVRPLIGALIGRYCAWLPLRWHDWVIMEDQRPFLFFFLDEIRFTCWMRTRMRNFESCCGNLWSDYSHIKRNSEERLTVVRLNNRLWCYFVSLSTWLVWCCLKWPQVVQVKLTHRASFSSWDYAKYLGKLDFIYLIYALYLVLECTRLDLFLRQTAHNLAMSLISHHSSTRLPPD